MAVGKADAGAINMKPEQTSIQQNFVESLTSSAINIKMDRRTLFLCARHRQRIKNRMQFIRGLCEFWTGYCACRENQ